MIRYDISQTQLERRVDSENATWRERAKERTEELFRGRADVIQKLGLAFRVRDTASTSELTRERCQAIIDYHTSDGAPHTNCGRAFAKLWRANPTRAEKLWNEAVDFLATISPPRQRSHGGRSV